MLSSERANQNVFLLISLWPRAPSPRLEETDFRACECGFGRDQIDRQLSEQEVNSSQWLKGFISQLAELLVGDFFYFFDVYYYRFTPVFHIYSKNKF